MGLATLFGGPAGLVEKLDAFFFQSQAWTPDYLPADYYWHGNEPDIHAPFLYAAVGYPDKTAEWAAWARGASHQATRDRAARVGIQLEWDCERARTPEGYYPIRGGIEYGAKQHSFPAAARMLQAAGGKQKQL